MIEVVEAPSSSSLEDRNNIKVFLGGGISNCPDWQSDVISKLQTMEELSPYSIVLYNPRRANFDVNDPTGAYEQIGWEFDKLQKMNIFSMYFCNSESVQPICMYELGRYVARMQSRFPVTWIDRIIVSVEEGYSRAEDVRIQLLECGVVCLNGVTLEHHIDRLKTTIMKASYLKLI